MKILSLVVFVFGVVAIQAVERSSRREVAEFERRNEVVNTALDKLEAYDRNKNRRINETLLQDFFMYFDRNFDDSDEWLYTALVERDTIVKTVMTESKFDYAKVETFLKDAKVLVESAFDVHIAYLELQGNDTEELEEEQKEASRDLNKLRRETLSFIETTAWKSQFKKDVDDVLKQHGNSRSAEKELVKFLSKKYPFRSWLAVVADREKSSETCTTEIMYKTSFGRRQSQTAFVFQAEASRLGRHLLANDVLNNIRRNGRYDTCEDAASRIFKESGYNCRFGKLPAFAVFQADTSGPRMATDDSHKVYRKRVTREGRRCREEFEAVILA